MNSAFPLERTFQNLVQHAQDARDAAFDWRAPEETIPIKSCEPAFFEDWESVLQNSNAANDEMCSENGRLRAEIERLRAEEREAEEMASPETSEQLKGDDSDLFKDGLLSDIVAAVCGVLADRCAALESEFENEHRSKNADGNFEAKSNSVDVVEDAQRVGGEGHSDDNHTAPLGDTTPVEGEIDINVTSNDEDSKADVKSSCESALDPDVTKAVKEQIEAVKEQIEAAVRAAFKEDAESSTPAPCLTPAEETAVLVGERVALRELVERQQEHIRALEAELRAAGVSQAETIVNNTVNNTMSLYTNAQEALSAGMKTVLVAKEKDRAAIVGAEYEVIGRRGTIVRNGESLRSDTVSDLAPGSRIRVVALSEKYPRRVEIICLRTSGTVPDASPEQMDTTKEEKMSGQGDTKDLESVPPPEADPSRVSLVTGWISAYDKDNRPLIRLAPKSDKANSGSNEMEDDREEGNVEIADVTLSQDEWQALHQDSEASTQKVEDLSAQLNKMGFELLQSFEMRSVLGELLHSVERAQDRFSRMGEVAAMTCAELEQRKQDFWSLRHSIQESKQSVQSGNGIRSESSRVSPKSRKTSRVEVHDGQGSDSSPSGERIQSFDKVDWDRLMTERETTAAALSAGLQRVDVLEREVKEIDAEREALDSHGRKDIGGLRASLRRRAKPMMAAMSKVFQSSSASSSSNNAMADFPVDATAAEGLFKRRIEDLQAEMAEVQEELSRACANEKVIKRTIRVRKNALRGLLHQGATRDVMTPQCGPLQLKASAVESERRALQVAVEEQLNCNLDLHSAYGLPHRRPLSMLAAEHGI